MVRATKQNSEIVSLKFDNNDSMTIRKVSGNYYFIVKMDDESKKTIEISLHDYDLYKSFDKLYKRFIDYRPFDCGVVDKSFKQEDAESDYPLVKDGVITWYSDNERFDKANSIQIEKTDYSYLLTINKKKNNRDKALIKVDTNNSRYSFFYHPIVELFNEVEEMEFDYPQISIEEYLVKSKIKKRK